MKNEPRLYILMRSDMTSMNAGKGMAQAAHAANAFVNHVNSVTDTVVDGYSVWEHSTPQGFGTTITLAVTGQEMYDAVDAATSMDLIAGVVHDPSYPIRDGDVTHLIPLDTCAYVFIPESTRTLEELSALPLHP